MRLLVVDDEPHVREMMRLTLETAGYDVDDADSGEAALARFGDGSRYAAVLLDQKMPGLDGLETMKRLLAVASDARIVMVTAFASVELAVDAMRAGAVHFVRKPTTPDVLRSAVAAALADPPRRHDMRPAEPSRSGAPPIQRLTLNGFRIDLAPDATSDPNAHVFVVTHFPDGPPQTVTVTIDPDAIDRVARLTRRRLPPSSAFWRGRAERLLSGHLWSEGRLPDSGQLIVRDLSRDDVELAASWIDQ